MTFQPTDRDIERMLRERVAQDMPGDIQVTIAAAIEADAHRGARRWPAWRFESMNTYAKFALAAAAVLVVAVVGAQLFGPAGDSGAGAGPMTPEPSVPAPTATPEPSAAEPSPTIAPSPVSTASATWAEFSDHVGVSASAKWDEFSNHVGVSANEISEMIAEADRVGPNDADGLMHSWQKIQGWAGREAVWLDTHPSAACYAGTYTPWSHVVRRVDEGFLPKFTQSIAEIKYEMKKAMDSIPTSVAACGT